MKIENNYNLLKLNTFGISVYAKFFTEVENENNFQEIILSPEFVNNNKLFLGGGSNILFTKDFDGIVVLNKLKGINIVNENEDSVLIRAMGGEMWQDFVFFVVSHGYWGAENLSLIPGTVGAAPVQNIGAYGVEIKEILENVEAFDIKTGEKRIFKKGECELGYRDSVFKRKLKGRYFITAVTFKLRKIEKKNVTYKALKDYVEKNNIEIKNPKDISDVVSDIRRSKLPDPAILGNAGSFFKNIFVEKEKLDDLLKKYPNIPYFEEEGFVKIPAGWLIEQCGWKGKRVGNVGVHNKQALVLVNYGGATGDEVKNLSEQIINSVFEKFSFKLVPEVNLI